MCSIVAKTYMPYASYFYGVFFSNYKRGQCMHAKSLQSCPTLCNPMNSSPPGSSVHGILQARILEWVAISFSKRSQCCCCQVASVVSNSVHPHRWQPTRLCHPWDSPGENTEVGCHFLLQCVKVKSESEVAQSCLTLQDPMNCSLPGSSAHGIFQARVLEWVAIVFSERRQWYSIKY